MMDIHQSYKMVNCIETPAVLGVHRSYSDTHISMSWGPTIWLQTISHKEVYCRVITILLLTSFRSASFRYTLHACMRMLCTKEMQGVKVATVCSLCAGNTFKFCSRKRLKIWMWRHVTIRDICGLLCASVDIEAGMIVYFFPGIMGEGLSEAYGQAAVTTPLPSGSPNGVVELSTMTFSTWSA